MTTTPPNIKKSLSEFMAYLDAEAGTSGEAREDLAWLIEAAENAGETFEDVEVSPAFRPLRRATAYGVVER